MTIPSEPSGKRRAGMDRREFLQCAAGGLVFSALTTRSAYGSTAEELSFASDGFSLTLQIPKTGGVQLQSLSNPKTKFEWARPGTSINPVWTAAGQSTSDWTSKRGTRKRAAAGDQ